MNIATPMATSRRTAPIMMGHLNCLHTTKRSVFSGDENQKNDVAGRLEK